MRILICPLNWGLGHASRDIVIIRKLLDREHQVIIAADGPALEILKNEFPRLEYVPFPSSVNVTYFRSLPAWLKIFIISPLLGYETLREHYRLKRIVRKTEADLVISDNRYGLWHTRIPSVLITHQLNPRLPRFLGFLDHPLAGLIRLMIRQFHRCWVPDFPGNDNLTGDLAHKFTLPGNVVFIGPLSKFIRDPESRVVSRNITAKDHLPLKSLEPIVSAELVILLSGPEPQRTKLENIILDQVRDIPRSSVILQGLPGGIIRREASPNVTIYNHLPSGSIKSLLENAKYIICRGGYTSIMDLVSLGKPAMIIPTPGQTEQEYLAGHLSARGVFLMMEQQSFNLQEAFRQLKSYKSKIHQHTDKLLDEEIIRWF